MATHDFPEGYSLAKLLDFLRVPAKKHEMCFETLFMRAREVRNADITAIVAYCLQDSEVLL